MVIYVDTLLIINFFMTFFLLRITALISKKSFTIIRAVIASAVGGAYSLVILLGDVPDWIMLVSKVLSSCVIVLVAFRFYRVRSFLICLGLFVFSSFVMLGVVVGAYFLSHSGNIAIKNYSFYLDISAKGLILAGFLSYVLSSIVVRIYNRVLSSREIYTLVLENNGDRVTVLAILDTGNKLREPFSDDPVIVVNSDSVSNLMNGCDIRYVPASGVVGGSLLPAFRPDKVTIRSSKGSEVIENVYVAVAENMNNTEFSAVLNPEILSV